MQRFELEPFLRYVEGYRVTEMNLVCNRRLAICMVLHTRVYAAFRFPVSYYATMP